MKRLLIANRGEIALRVLRACRDLEDGPEAVSVYTLEDRQMPYLDLADDRVCIAEHSYLDQQALLAAALSRGCDAVHPGYGFLSENDEFAAAVEAQGLTFIGPTPAQIAQMADKSAAREFMREHQVPIIPGTAALGSLDDAVIAAASTGYPVMLKASRGGGGRGIRPVADEATLRDVWPEVQQQAESLFGDSAVYLEKFLQGARHIELQVFGDGKGQVAFLGARDCSVQRHHQKLIEESPPAGISADSLAELAAPCLTALQSIHYRSAGTLEFLWSDGQGYFLEMNTRIQVEHPVTECLFGLDLVRMQLQLAAGAAVDPLPELEDFEGHAIECRLNAEGPGFVPSPGWLSRFDMPGGPGVRVDTHLQQGCPVSHHYDSLLAKLIVTGLDRQHAISAMKRAMAEVRVEGVATNRNLHLSLLNHPRFVSAEHDINLLSDDVIDWEH